MTPQQWVITYYRKNGVYSLAIVYNGEHNAGMTDTTLRH